MMSVSIARTSDHTMQLSAAFDSFDPTGTIETTVTINATTTIETTNGKITYSAPIVDFDVTIANEALGFFVTSSGGISTSQNIMVDPNLRTAHVTAVVPLVDLTGQTYQANVNLSWKAIDAVQTNISKTITMNGRGSVIIDNTVGDGDDAVATGIVSLINTQSFAPVPDATPLSSFEGSIQKVNEGTTTITVTIPPKCKFSFPSFGANSILLDATDALSKLTGM